MPIFSRDTSKLHALFEFVREQLTYLFALLKTKKGKMLFWFGFLSFMVVFS